MSWAEVKRFINSGDVPLNEYLKPIQPIGVVQVNKNSFTTAGTHTFFNVSGSGKLLMVAIDSYVGGNSSNSLKIEIDGKVLTNSILASSYAGNRKNYFLVGNPSYITQIASNTHIFGLGATVNNNSSINTMGFGDGVTLTTAASSGAMLHHPIYDFIEFKNSLKITFNHTSDNSTATTMVHYALD